MNRKNKDEEFAELETKIGEANVAAAEAQENLQELVQHLLKWVNELIDDRDAERKRADEAEAKLKRAKEWVRALDE